METIENKTFINEAVELDGKGFIKCKFIGCHLIFRGKEPFGLREEVLDNVTMEFADHAALTVEAINALYKSGGDFRQWIEHELKGTLGHGGH